MRRGFSSFVVLFVLFLVIGVLPNQVQAFDTDGEDAVGVKITKASYLDLDKDKQKDDILTIFDILIPQNAYVLFHIRMSIELPSGLEYDFAFLLESYTSIEVAIGWYNTVSESGWYRFKVVVKIADGLDLKGGCDIVDFDPPELNPGLPDFQLIYTRVIM
ncbi:MAG: hypothetical protein ACFFEF_13705 [Candidatus Thorarchaeota archaeon]